jgi:hypothetical protein
MSSLVEASIHASVRDVVDGDDKAAQRVLENEARVNPLCGKSWALFRRILHGERENSGHRR